MAATAASTSEPRLDGLAGRLPEAAGARLSELFARHASMVVGVCRGMLRHREEAEDAAQQTFLAAYKALLGGTEPREPAAWLATIARNECRRRIADRMRAGVPIGTVEETLAHHATPISPSDVSALREAIAGLPPMQQRAILLREFVGLSYDEVAEELAVTQPAVESLLFRARRTLQARLRPALGAAFGVGPIPALREALAQLVPGFTASSGGGIAALAALPAAAKLAAGVAAIGLVAGGTVVAVEVERGPRHRPKPPAVLPLAGADVAAAAPVTRPSTASLAAAAAPDSRRGRLGAGATRGREQPRRAGAQSPAVLVTTASLPHRAPVAPAVSSPPAPTPAPKESPAPAGPISVSEPVAPAPVAPALPTVSEEPTTPTPSKDEGQSGPGGGTADDDEHSGPGGGGAGEEDEDHSGPGGGDDGEDHSGPGGGGDDDVSGGTGSSGTSGSSSGSGSGEEADDESGGSSGSGSSGSGSSGSGSSDSGSSGSSGSGSGSGSGKDDGD